MSNLTRWNPYQEMAGFRRLMRRMFDDPFMSQDFDLETSSYWEVPLDVLEDQDGYSVKAVLPGIKPDDIDITYNNNTLTIHGEVKQEDEQKEQHYHLRERRFGSFQRSIYLPTAVDSGKIQADYADGILTLHLPKTEEVKPKRIAVHTGAQHQIEGKVKAAR
ncbi:MAG TPA: Hsp20/alpha crystallin family protein [Anaerolineaceae bacterium]